MSSKESEEVRSEAYRLAVIRSEQWRVVWILLALTALLAFVITRTIVTGLGANRAYTVAVITFFGVAIGYEFVVLVLLRRSDYHLDRSPLVGMFNVVAEATFPSAVLLCLALVPLVGPFDGLNGPAVSLYFLVIIFSTLRLNPTMCVVSGAVSTVGYLVVVMITIGLYPEPPASDGALPLPVYATSAFMMLVAGIVAAAIAGQIRGHVLAALREARASLDSRNAIIFGLAKLAEFRDTDTGAHLVRIAEYSEILGEALKEEHGEIDESWIEDLKLASSMHDIGKVGIPDDVLQKPGRLTDDERENMKRHPTLGAETLAAIREKLREDPLIDMSIRIAMTHHERWDGKGYPTGLDGKDIALAARIVAVADVYDALTSKRVYKDAMSHEDACQAIREGEGTQFDPVVVAAFLGVQDHFDTIRREHAGANQPS